MTACEYQNDGHRITQPGKFEGEPVFAPHYWQQALEGFSDADDGRVFTFRFALNGRDSNCPFYTELKRWLGRKRSLKMWEDDQGFVHCA
jgi:hypothetical protein